MAQPGLGDAARCMVCNQGRESKASVDGQIAKFNVTDVDAVVASLQEAGLVERVARLKPLLTYKKGAMQCC